ncbi:MAG: hypothetical protein WBP45_07240 [Daejeonella sp.]
MMKASKFLNKIDGSQLSPCMKAVLADVKNLSNGFRCSECSAGHFRCSECSAGHPELIDKKDF